MKNTSKRADSGVSATRARRRRVVEYVLIFVGGVLLVDAFVGDKGLLAMMKKRAEYRALEQSLVTAREENARLRGDAQRLKDDPAAVEDIARRELGMIKPGEKLFIIRDVSPADAARKK